MEKKWGALDYFKERVVSYFGIQCRMTNNSLLGVFTCAEYVTELKKQKLVIIRFL